LEQAPVRVLAKVLGPVRAPVWELPQARAPVLEQAPVRVLARELVSAWEQVRALVPARAPVWAWVSAALQESGLGPAAPLVSV